MRQTGTTAGGAASRATERHIGLIGYGVAGQACARLLLTDPAYRLTVLTRSPIEDPPADERLAVVTSLEALIAAGPQMIVEAASAEAFAPMVRDCLSAGIDVVAASIGALQSPETWNKIIEACHAGGSCLYLPSGAVGGLDYLAAAALSGEIAVTYTSRKPPAAWSAELEAAGLTAQARTQPITLFEGTAMEAAALYPRNLNAGLTVALAAGIDRTRVRVVADPSVSANIHEIAVTGAAGEAFMRFANKPSPENPKTSLITALSLASVVQRRFEPLR